ncbi:hypothetical protein [Pontibacter mangrovi]|uniref:Uncharacterized protein n=1 Tax=Pontibacter mangrovi TaxID=2589816 RepID=A0A501W2T4_9BACT|nr:hypothetical protein [Pontibacter mangrovi]TPE43588.1 hypothetical protein FJM65_12595 [Pontibacter mangrovi]
MLLSFRGVAQSDFSFLTREQLVTLNREYARVLQQERSRRIGRQVEVIFDENLLYATYIFNHELYEAKDIYHYGDRHSEPICEECAMVAELCGYSTRDDYKDIAELAKAIFMNFQESARHGELQMNEFYTYVSVSYVSNTYVVRMAALPHNIVDQESPIINSFNKLIINTPQRGKYDKR